MVLTMPKINDQINRDNQKFIKEVKAEAKADYEAATLGKMGRIARIAAKANPRSDYNKGLKKVNSYIDAKLDGQPIEVLDYNAQRSLKRTLSNAATHNFNVELVEMLETNERELFSECKKCIDGLESSSRKVLNIFYQSFKFHFSSLAIDNEAVKKVKTLNSNIHSLDFSKSLKIHFLLDIANMGDERQAKLIESISSSKVDNLLGAIVRGAGEKITSTELIKLTEILSGCKTDLEVEMKARFIMATCKNLKGGFTDKNIAIILANFQHKPEMGWDEGVNKQSKEQQIRTAAYLIANYPGLCVAIRDGYGGKINNEQLIKAFAQIAIESEIMHNDHTGLKGNAEYEKQFALKERLLARLERKIHQEPLTREVISDVLKVNDASKHNYLDKRVCRNVLIAVDHPRVFKELEKADNKVAKVDAPQQFQLEHKLIGLQESLREKLPEEMRKNKHVHPLVLAEDYLKQNKGGLRVLEGEQNPFRTEQLDAHKQKAENKHMAAERKRRESQSVSHGRA